MEWTWEITFGAGEQLNPLVESGSELITYKRAGELLSCSGDKVSQLVRQGVLQRRKLTPAGRPKVALDEVLELRRSI